jgi:hypothetical protein
MELTGADDKRGGGRGKRGRGFDEEKAPKGEIPGALPV